ncbi:deoxyribodipyrimidine photo-lyase, partial [Pseudomonas chlororaphis]
MQLIWLRSDLRLHDNTALSAATQRGPTVAVYLLSPRQWQAHDDAPCKVDFWLRNLEQLSGDLARLNIPLLIREAPSWELAPQVLLQLCRELAIEALHVNEEYGIHESRRDTAVANLLKGQGVSFHSYLDQLLFRPGSVLTRSGGYFQVFSQFRKVCYNRLHSTLPPQLAAPRMQATLKIKADAVPRQVEGFSTPDPHLQALWPAGENVAQQRLAHFAEAQLDHYQAERDFPAKPGTSQLSPYLTAGVLSPRQCLHA